MSGDSPRGIARMFSKTGLTRFAALRLIGIWRHDEPGDYANERIDVSLGLHKLCKRRVKPAQHRRS
jgi:hypothetical protein